MKYFMRDVIFFYISYKKNIVKKKFFFIIERKILQLQIFINNK